VLASVVVEVHLGQPSGDTANDDICYRDSGPDGIETLENVR
jgi:hypothetical protein